MRTGAVVPLAAGKFSRTLAPGGHTVSSGDTVTSLSLIAGGRNEIPDLRISENVRRTVIRISTKVEQAGSENMKWPSGIRQNGPTSGLCAVGI